MDGDKDWHLKPLQSGAGRHVLPEVANAVVGDAVAHSQNRDHGIDTARSGKERPIAHPNVIALPQLPGRSTCTQLRRRRHTTRAHLQHPSIAAHTHTHTHTHTQTERADK